MPRRLDSTWAEWGAPEGGYLKNPPEPEATLYRRDRNGFVWERRVGLKDWVTVSEAANILRVNPVTAWQWAKTGRLPAKKRRKLQVVRFGDVVALAMERGSGPALASGIYFTN